jgi:exodeoxyribonuclease-3
LGGSFFSLINCIKFLKDQNPHVFCIQETKAQIDQLSQDFFPEDYHAFFQSAERKGYSGTAVYCKEKPLEVEILGAADFDIEGRTQVLHFEDFSLMNNYFPNSQAEGKRINYKVEFCDALLERAEKLVQQGRNVIICGDYNIAHKPIDLANPKQNEKNPGYLPEERQWMEKFLSSGWVDTFRVRHPEPDQYTWWSYRMKARDRNVGWRIDYHCVNQAFDGQIKESVILPEVLGSDHCPVKISF